MLAETDLVKKIAKFCRATYLTASARIDTARKGSITAWTELDNNTNRARKMHGSGTKSAQCGLENGTSWSRNRHVIRSKTVYFGLEVGTQTPNGRARKQVILAREQRFYHFAWIKFCSNTIKNIIKSKIKQIKRWNLEYMIYGIGALHSSHLV